MRTQLLFLGNSLASSQSELAAVWKHVNPLSGEDAVVFCSVDEIDQEADAVFCTEQSAAHRLESAIHQNGALLLDDPDGQYIPSRHDITVAHLPLESLAKKVDSSGREAMIMLGAYAALCDHRGAVQTPFDTEKITAPVAARAFKSGYDFVKSILL